MRGESCWSWFPFYRLPNIQRERKTVMEAVFANSAHVALAGVTRRTSRRQIASVWLLFLLWHACFELLETRDRARISSFRFNCRSNPFSRKDFEILFYKYFYVSCEEIEWGKKFVLFISGIDFFFLCRAKWSLVLCFFYVIFQLVNVRPLFELNNSNVCVSTLYHTRCNRVFDYISIIKL